MVRIKKIGFFSIKDIWFDTFAFANSNCAITALHTNDVLEETVYDFKLVAKTFLLNIEDDKEKIFTGFEYKSARYAINKAVRDGVCIYKVKSPEELEQYMEFQKAFCEQKEIPVLSTEELAGLHIYYAMSKEAEYLGACAFIESEDKKTVRYKYGATLHKLNANEAILWHVICEYHDKGFAYFDFGGCIPTDDKNAYYYRHYRFKKKFGGELIDSYTYFKIKGIYRGLYVGMLVFVKIFFKGDINNFTNWLNRWKILR